MSSYVVGYAINMLQLYQFNVHSFIIDYYGFTGLKNPDFTIRHHNQTTSQNRHLYTNLANTQNERISEVNV